MIKPKILFYCRYNSIRSQMAEAILRKYAGSRVDVFSAGLELHDIHPYTYQVMAEKDIDMRGQSVKSIWQYYGKYHFRFMIQLSDPGEITLPKYPEMSEEVLNWKINDPLLHPESAANLIIKFRKVRDEIDFHIRELLEKTGLQIAPFGYPWFCLDETTPLVSSPRYPN